MYKKYCINCGTLVPLQANFCPSCGAPQGIESRHIKASAPAINFSVGSVATQSTVSTPHASTHAKNSTPHAQQEDDTYEDIPKTKLCKNAKWAFFLEYFFKTATLPGLMLFGFLVQPLATIGAFVLYFFILYISASIVYENFTYSTDEVGFKKAYGAVHKRKVSIPYQQIQNVNISRNVTDRMLGLCHVSIETAGSTAVTAQSAPTSTKKSTAEGYLPGLNLEQAKYLHDLLLARSQD